MKDHFKILFSNIFFPQINSRFISVKHFLVDNSTFSLEKSLSVFLGQGVSSQLLGGRNTGLLSFLYTYPNIITFRCQQVCSTVFFFSFAVSFLRIFN